MNVLKKLMYSTLATGLVAEQSFAAINFGKEKVDAGVSGDADTADKVVQTLVARAMMFLAILAVLYGIYGGFLIVTAGGAEEKVKQGKTILIQVGIGLIVIFLANSIVQFILQRILSGSN